MPALTPSHFVLRKRDLPAGWVVAGKATKSSQSGCSTTLPSRRASSPVFGKKGAQIASIAFVYARVGVARIALARLADPKQQRCFESHYLKQVRKGTPSAKLRAAPARRPKHAQTAFGFVIAYTAGGKTARVHYELVALRRGRIVCELIATSPSGPPSSTLVQRATTVLAARAASG